MLAMVVNDDAGYLTPRGVLRFIASMLAPTEEGALITDATSRNDPLPAAPPCTTHNPRSVH
jgi:hypothetical protein